MKSKETKEKREGGGGKKIRPGLRALTFTGRSRKKTPFS